MLAAYVWIKGSAFISYYVENTISHLALDKSGFKKYVFIYLFISQAHMLRYSLEAPSDRRF